MPHKVRADIQLLALVRLSSSVCLPLQFRTLPSFTSLYNLLTFIDLFLKKHFSCFQHHRDVAGRGLDRERSGSRSHHPGQAIPQGQDTWGSESGQVVCFVEFVLYV